MSIIDEIKANLVSPDKHGPVLEALAAILEEEGERGVKSLIKQWVEEIQAEDPPVDNEEG